MNAEFGRGRADRNPAWIRLVLVIRKPTFEEHCDLVLGVRSRKLAKLPQISSGQVHSRKKMSVLVRKNKRNGEKRLIRMLIWDAARSPIRNGAAVAEPNSALAVHFSARKNQASSIRGWILVLPKNEPGDGRGEGNRPA